jgi:hypothetical protein
MMALYSYSAHTVRDPMFFGRVLDRSTKLELPKLIRSKVKTLRYRYQLLLAVIARERQKQVNGQQLK